MTELWCYVQYFLKRRITGEEMRILHLDWNWKVKLILKIFLLEHNWQGICVTLMEILACFWHREFPWRMTGFQTLWLGEYESIEANCFLLQNALPPSIGTANISGTHRCYNKGHNKPFTFSRNFHFCDLTEFYSIAVKKAVKLILFISVL